MGQDIQSAVSTRCRQNLPRLLTVLTVVFMVIMAAAPAPLQAASQVAEIMLSDQADANGVVAQHQNKFAPTVGEIYGTALINAGDQAKQVTTELFYVTQNLKVLSVPQDLTERGQVTFTFAFPKPSQGWPPGDYKLIISTSDGASKELTFQVK
jgi:hypothetical protein